jgi:outer membrane lipoprotein-sorting protein
MAKWQGKFVTVADYRIWLKKPNYARVEMTRAGQKEPSGILVGDGDYFWIYLPQGKIRYGWEKSGEYAKETRHDGPGPRNGPAERRTTQAVQLPGPDRLVQQMAVWLTRLPRGDRESPETLREIS